MHGLRVSEHASDSGFGRVASLAPRGPLEPYILALHAYEERNVAFRRRRDLPDGSAVLIFNLGKPLRVEHPASVKRTFGEGEGFFSGASASYAVTETEGAQTGAQIKLTLLGARLSLGAPLGEFGDAQVDPVEALGRTAAELRHRLADTRTQDGRIKLLGRFVAHRLARHDGIAPGLVHAFRRLSRGDIRIADAAREIGMGRERFSKAFRREFGLSPKTFARVRRFNRALSRRKTEPLLNGAAMAAECGYFDQAHMIREFSGASPAALWRRQLPDGGGFVD